MMNRLSAKLLLVVAIVGTFLSVCEVPAHAKKDDLMEIIASSFIGGVIGEGLGEAIKSASQMRQTMVEANQEIQIARKRFWAEYPSGQNRAVAEAEFSRLLEAKDLHYLWLASMNWRDAKNSKKMGTGQIIQMIGGQHDKGIPPSAREAFERWVEAVMENYEREMQTGNDWVSSMITVLPAAIEAAPRQYQAYKFERDWAEFDAAGREPEWVKTPHGSVLYIIYRFGKESPEQAAEIYHELIEVFGEKHVHEAAMKVRKAGISSDGFVRDLDSLGLTEGRFCTRQDHTTIECEGHIPLGAIYAGTGFAPKVFNVLLGVGDLRHYIMSLHFARAARKEETSRKILWRWKNSDKFHRNLIAAYGESAVLDVARRLQKAPKRPEDGELKVPDQFGNVSSNMSYYVLGDLLAQQNPKGYVRSMIFRGYTHDLYRQCYLTSWYAEKKKLTADQVKDISLAEMEKEVGSPGAVTKRWELKNDQIKKECSGRISALGPSESVMEAQYDIAKARYGEDVLLKAGKMVAAFFVFRESRSSACGAIFGGDHPADGPTSRSRMEQVLLREILDPISGTESSDSQRVFENLAYRAWAKFAPGAHLVMQAKGLFPIDGDYTITLDSVTVENSKASIASIAKPAEKGALVINRWDRVEGLVAHSAPSAANLQFVLAAIQLGKYQPIRTQLLAIGERQVEAKVYFFGGNTQVWTSEQIPGGIARILWDQGKFEMAVKSFNGTAADIPSSGSSEMSTAVDLSKLTCKVVVK